MAYFGVACSYPLHSEPPNWQCLQGRKEEVFVFKVYFHFLPPPSLPPSPFPLPTSFAPSPFPPHSLLPLSPSLCDVMSRGPGFVSISWMSNRFHFEVHLCKINQVCLEDCVVKDSEAQSRLIGRMRCNQLMMSVKGTCHIYLLILL